MPKRKHEKYSECDYDRLSKKLKKLERKIKRSRQRRCSSSSTASDSDKPLPPDHMECIVTATDKSVDNQGLPEDLYLAGCSYWENISEPPYTSASVCNEMPLPYPSVDELLSLTPAIAVNTGADPSAIEPQAPPPLPALQPPPPATAVYDSSTGIVPPEVTDLPAGSSAAAEIIELDSDVMEILGEDPTHTKEYGPDIQKDLAIRLNHIAVSGLSTEIRKDLKEKYLIPSNCKFIQAPVLNPEIRASLSESQAKRDKGIENKQKMTACALSSISAAITLFFRLENKSSELLKLLMDTARSLSLIQHGDSTSRRSFILSTVKKELKDQLEKTKIDEYLFGSNLSETLKCARNIHKSGADIRSATFNKPVAAPPAKSSNRALNYRAPPSAYHRGAGAARGRRMTTRAPATTLRQMTTSRPSAGSGTSSRQPPQRHNKR